MKILVVILAVSMCAGCSGAKKEFGNIAKVNSSALVQDAASILLATYPPAKVRLALAQEVDDSFGDSLMETLRANGYAVAEYVKPTRRDKYLAAVKRPNGMAFAYLLDSGNGRDELRVSLHVGSETLSRLYSVIIEGEEVRYIPRGFWTRRVGGSGTRE